jgi:esterase/lipase superfamily enzyme
MMTVTYDPDVPLELLARRSSGHHVTIEISPPTMGRAERLVIEATLEARVRLDPRTEECRFRVAGSVSGPANTSFAVDLIFVQSGHVRYERTLTGRTDATGVGRVDVEVHLVPQMRRGPVGADRGEWTDSPRRSRAHRRSATVEPEQSDAEYVVWYGTNRRPANPGDVSQGYSAERDSTVHYGSCRVFVPKSHKIGSMGSPWWKRLLTLTDDRLRLLEIRQTAGDAYWRDIAAQLAAVDPQERHAVIFIHGYNVSFESAALRAAQIGFDLSIRGAMAFFAWPSQGTLAGYPADEATIEASEGVIADFMVDFAGRSDAQSVHVIAHSMGNRAVLRAVNRLGQQAQRRSGARFGQFILAAADVDADTFRHHSGAYGRVARRATLYVSGRDVAVEASRWLHQFPRAGLVPPVMVTPGIDTINVTNVDLTMLGHGYVADARDVLHDIHALIRHGASPEMRFGLREARSEDNRRYWLIGA